MRKMKNWIVNKRLYNIKRNANLVCLGAYLDLETFNKIQKIKEKKGISNNVEYVRLCYNIMKGKVEND